MWGHRWIVLRALFILFVASASAHAQRPGLMMGAGMMGTRHDSATMAQMAVIHELILNHDRIARTVTNLPDGIRTVTESNDPLIARRIKEHVVTMNQRVAAADDPGLPMRVLPSARSTAMETRSAPSSTPQGRALSSCRPRGIP